MTFPRTSITTSATLVLASLLLPQAVHAAIAATPWPASTSLTVVSTVQPAAAGALQHFSYVITNTAAWTVNGSIDRAALVQFTVPYFADSGITNITAPDGWSYAIGDANPFNLPGAGMLTWFGSVKYSTPPCDIPNNGNPNCIASAIAPDAMAVGFGFDAPFAAAKAPYTADFYLPRPTYKFYDHGDPAIPASPLALAAGLAALPVPEPATWAMGLLGVAVLGLRRRLR